MKWIFIWLTIFYSVGIYAQTSEQIADELCICFNVDSLTTKEAMASCIKQTVERHQLQLVGHENDLQGEEVGKVLMDMTPYLFDCKDYVNLANKVKNPQNNNQESTSSNVDCSRVNKGEFWSSDSVTVVILEDTEVMYPKTLDFTRIGKIEWIDSCSYYVTLETDGGEGILKKGDQYSSRIISIRGDSTIWETDFKGVRFKYFLIKK